MPTYQPFAGLTTQMLNSPLPRPRSVVQVTGKVLPCAGLVAPVGAVTLMVAGALHLNVAAIVWFATTLVNVYVPDVTAAGSLTPSTSTVVAHVARGSA